jgi:hypothetical protein
MTQEALKLALEALENGDVPTPENVGKNLDAITAIKEALAQTQEPVLSVQLGKSHFNVSPKGEMRIEWRSRAGGDMPSMVWNALKSVF